MVWCFLSNNIEYSVFFLTNSMCSLHDREQSTVRPRNLVELHMGIVLLLCSIVTSIWFVFLFVKFINCVLEKFKESKLFLNHSIKLLNMILISFMNLNDLGCDIKMLVYGITSAKCHINTVVSPDDGHIVARNM